MAVSEPSDGRLTETRDHLYRIDSERDRLALNRRTQRTATMRIDPLIEWLTSEPALGRPLLSKLAQTEGSDDHAGSSPGIPHVE